MSVIPKQHPGAIVQDENRIFRDNDIGGLIRLADESDRAAAQYLRRMFVQAVRRGDKPDKRLLNWVAARLYRLEWQGERADVALGIKPGKRPPVDSQGRYEKLVRANDIVCRVGVLNLNGTPVTKCFELVASELGTTKDKVECCYYEYRVPENTSQE